MKKILVPTDFSECSKHAVRYALAMAKKFENAELFFVHSIVLGKLIPDQNVTKGVAYGNVIDSIELGLQMFDDFLKEFDLDGIEYHRHLIRGRADWAITEFANTKGMDLVVIGTHGRSGLIEWSVGSVTQKVLRGVQCPIIAVKEFEGDLEIKNIVFVSDFAEESKQVFRDIAKFAEKFNARLHLLNIDTPNYFTEIPMLIKSSMKEFAEEYSGEVEMHRSGSWNIERGVETFLRDEIKADLVALSTHGKQRWRDAFFRSVAEGVVNHVNVPVLVKKIDPEDMA